jgi:hypothetical protein
VAFWARVQLSKSSFLFWTRDPKTLAGVYFARVRRHVVVFSILACSRFFFKGFGLLGFQPCMFATSSIFPFIFYPSFLVFFISVGMVESVTSRILVPRSWEFDSLGFFHVTSRGDGAKTIAIAFL